MNIRTITAFVLWIATLSACGGGGGGGDSGGSAPPTSSAPDAETNPTPEPSPDPSPEPEPEPQPEPEPHPEPVPEPEPEPGDTSYALPHDFAVFAGDGQVVASWTPGTGAHSYNLYWSTTTPVSPSTANKIENVTSPFVHAGLTNGTRYYYVLSAMATYGAEPLSAELSVMPPPSLVADFHLRDENSRSTSFGSFISPRQYEGYVSAWYFGQSTCEFCREQFERLNRLQNELLAENPGTAIRLLAVNQSGHESGNSSMPGSLPWVQDTPTVNVYRQWHATFRDVIVLDRQNLEVVRFNVDRNTLKWSTNYRQLKNLLKKAAGE